MVCDSDATIRSIRGGVVISSNDNGDWGGHVVISQEDGLAAVYAHLSARFVEVGETVVEGQFVGIMGGTGNASGVHLHLEIQDDYYNAFSHHDIAEYLGIVNSPGKVSVI